MRPLLESCSTHMRLGPPLRHDRPPLEMRPKLATEKHGTEDTRALVGCNRTFDWEFCNYFPSSCAHQHDFLTCLLELLAGLCPASACTAGCSTWPSCGSRKRDTTFTVSLSMRKFKLVVVLNNDTCPIIFHKLT